MWKRRKSDGESVSPDKSEPQATAPTTEKKMEVRIGPSTCLVGELFSAEETLIEGLVEGLVVVVGHRLTVGPKARIVGPVVADELVLMGTIDGDVEVKGKLAVHKDGHLAGDVRCYRIRIDDGAHFEGSVDVLDPTRADDPDLQLGSLAQAVAAADEPEEEPAQPPSTDWAEIDDVNAA
ncbi:MAG: polymer-forming cytoskeletal protein [Acidobacteria bacterium]|nr:polymer-forming cytoskeletal protein [Acidobacteriota bacterium]